MHGLDNTVGDWGIVARAEAQEGLVTYAQLRALGLSEDAIFARLRVGRLHRRHHLVYTVGHRLLRPRGEWLAACWAAGEGAVLSHLSAAAFYGWIAPGTGRQHVTTARAVTSRAGVCVHRASTIGERDVRRFGLLSVTRHARTVIDLAELLTFDELRAVVDRIPTRDLDVAEIHAALARAPRKRGAANVRRLLGRFEAHTKSEFERRYLRFCRRHGVPLPSGVNVRVAGFVVDCFYEEQRVVVELDGRAWHARRDQMATDRRRDRKLLRAGYASVRLVWEDLEAEASRETRSDLRELLDV